MTAFPRIVVPPVISVSSAAWSTINKNTNVSITGALTATSAAVGSSADYPGIANTSITTSQKIYWEVTTNAYAGGEMGLGVGNASTSFTTGNFLGFNTNSLCLFASGNVYYNGSPITTVEGLGASVVTSIAVDFSNGKIWFRKNSGNWNNNVSADPATNTGGITIGVTGNLFPAYNLTYDGTTQGQFIANFAGPFSFTVPSGFTHL